MKLLLLLFFSLCLQAMEEKQSLTKFGLFDNLPVALRAKVVMHLCDDVSDVTIVFRHRPAIEVPLLQNVLPHIMPILKTCKKYYLQDKIFTGELLKLISNKSQRNIFYAGFNVPTPACKRFLAEYKELEGDSKQQFDHVNRYTLTNEELRMLNDIKNNRIRFKESLQVAQYPNHQLNANQYND